MYFSLYIHERGTRIYIYIYIYIYIVNKVELATVVEGDQKDPFSLVTFPGLLHFTLDTYLILLNVEQGGIKYNS